MTQGRVRSTYESPTEIHRSTSGRVLTHNELHQQLLEVWHTGNVGFMPHRYRRCPQSGAGNCCCGRDDRATLHQEAS